MRRVPLPNVVILLLLSAVYLALDLPTLRSVGILWDEQNDIDVSRSYLASPAGFLDGSPDDPTQTRLPMYIVAAVFALLGRSDLALARLVSCLVSLLTLVAVYVYGRRFGRAQAVVAAALLATSPLFLAFSRVALTEGDAFITAAVAWFIVTLARALDRPTVGRTSIAGIILGLALSSKFMAVGLLPAVAMAPWLVKPSATPNRRSPPETATIVIVLATASAFVWAGFVLAWVYWFRPRSPEQAGTLFVAWASAAAGYVLSLVCVFQRRTQMLDRLTQPLVIGLLAGATLILVPPVHLTDPELLGSLKTRALESVAPDPVLMAQAVSLHVMTLLFKPSIIVGALLLVAACLAVCRWRVDPRVRLPLLAIAAYAAFLLKMPVAQTFYTMPILPMLAVLAAERLVALWQRRRLVGAALVAACVGWVAVDLRLSFPHYQLNGYQWLGERYILGLSTVSYRGVVQITSDGVEQTLAWVAQHAKPGDRVKTYIYPDHIVRAVSPHPAFILIDGLRPPSPSVDDVDYVITTMHGDIQKNSPEGLLGGGSVFRYPYDRAALLRHFDAVFRVRRPFDLDLATVWQRKKSASTSQGQTMSDHHRGADVSPLARVASGFSRKDACGARILSRLRDSHILPAEAGSHSA